MCQPLHENLARIEARIRAASRLSVFLDFDGTLVPIVEHPANVRLDRGVSRVLGRLSRRQNCVASIISGRSVSDLETRIGLKALLYAGNHGMEVSARGQRYVHPAALQRRERISELAASLEQTLSPIAGVWVENKGLTVSVHYRGAAISDVAEVECLVRASVTSMTPLFRLAMGNKVFEVLPRIPWDKGSAVRWINSWIPGPRPLSVYIGDDRTDEDAFAVLPDDITIKVGPGKTRARFHTTGPAFVHEFLARIAATPERDARPTPAVLVGCQ